MYMRVFQIELVSDVGVNIADLLSQFEDPIEVGEIALTLQHQALMVLMNT